MKNDINPQLAVPAFNNTVTVYNATYFNPLVNYLCWKNALENTDGSFTTAVSNSFLSPLEEIP